MLGPSSLPLTYLPADMNVKSILHEGGALLGLRHIAPGGGV